MIITVIYLHQWIKNKDKFLPVQAFFSKVLSFHLQKIAQSTSKVNNDPIIFVSNMDELNRK